MGEPHSVKVTARMTKQEVKDLDALARRVARNRADTIRMLLRERLQAEALASDRSDPHA